MLPNECTFELVDSAFPFFRRKSSKSRKPQGDKGVQQKEKLPQHTTEDLGYSIEVSWDHYKCTIF